MDIGISADLMQRYRLSENPKISVLVQATYSTRQTHVRTFIIMSLALSANSSSYFI